MRMIILSKWVHNTVMNPMLTERVDRHMIRYYNMRVRDWPDQVHILGPAYSGPRREWLNLRPIRGAPPIGRGYARYQPLP